MMDFSNTPHQPINRKLTPGEQAAFAACSCEICGCTSEDSDVVLTGKVDVCDDPEIQCNHCGNTGSIGSVGRDEPLRVAWEHEHLCGVCGMPSDILAEPWEADHTEVCEDCHKE